ncbi:MAG TPA: hypothetical protein VGI39_08285 [Polyangiaceae bacterium]
MRTRSVVSSLAFVSAALAFVAGSQACSGGSSNVGFGDQTGGQGAGTGTGTGTGTGNNDGGSTGGPNNGGGGPIGSVGDGGNGTTTPPPSSDGGVACPTGLQCNVSCSNNGTTSISGKVYDPAGNNPLYNVAVYVPASPLTALPKGVPTGNDACSCGALFQSGALSGAFQKTGVDGSFTLNNVPVGSNVPLVLQIGKWRKSMHINVTACTNNVQPDKSLKLPGTVAAGSDDSMPDIAVSTGGADTLECLMRRIGLPASEYVAGSGTSGHVHIFAGGDSSGGGGGLGGGTGAPETPGMAGAPDSPTNLWSSQAQLMPYDIVLLSCEGGETYNANPSALHDYLNAGGRAFASHFHYSWFSGPLSSGQSYSAPSDWGNALATWSQDTGNSNGPVGGTIQTTLNTGGGAFQKGQILQQWLTNVGALGQGVAAGQLSIYSPRYNAAVSTGNAASQPWINSPPSSGGGFGGGGTPTGGTMYFSFDTPVGGTPSPDGGAPTYCGRGVFSDLHVSGDPSDSDTSSPPNGCGAGALSPQEKALEFMLFDLSSCVVPVNVPEQPDAGPPPPPPK